MNSAFADFIEVGEDTIVGAGAVVPKNLERIRFSTRPPERSGYAEGEGRRSLTPEERCRLFGWFEKDIAQLEKLIERDLSLWRPS